MAKLISFLTIFLIVIIPSIMFAQQDSLVTKKSNDTSKVKSEKASSNVITNKQFNKQIWSKVKKLNKKYRQYNIEKPQSVAGVRGKAKDENLSKKMYYKGGEKYPNIIEVKKAINMLNNMLKDKEVKEDDKPEIYFFIAQCYAQLNDTINQEKYLSELIKKYPKSKYSLQAKELLKKNK